MDVYLEVNPGCFNGTMPEHIADHRKGHFLAQHVGSQAVSEGMRPFMTVIQGCKSGLPKIFCGDAADCWRG